MTCKSCAERRAKWKKKLAEKKAKRQGLQAAAIGAALGRSERSVHHYLSRIGMKKARRRTP